MRITVFDYGAGNLHSLLKALAADGARLAVETDLRAALHTDLLVLPGVGAFGAAAARMGSARADARDALRAGLPCVGICLGMQLLFDRSDEGPGDGIGLVPGTVTRLAAGRVPQVGWNDVESAAEPLLARAGLRLAYYANAYACRPADPRCVSAWTTHETDRFPALVRAGRTLGIQFHPEKSSQPGVRFLREIVSSLAAA